MTEVNRFDIEIFLNSNVKEKPSILKEFAEKQQNSEVFSIVFTGADSYGNMYYYHRENINEYKVEMLAEDRVSKQALLRNSYPVMVKEIDYEAKTIYVSNRMARDVIREKLIADILKALKEGYSLRTKARIAYIRENQKGHSFLELNLAGVNVRGYLFRDDWSTCYTAELRGMAKVGEIIDVEIMDVFSPKRFNFDEPIDVLPHKFIFLCSRKNALPFNPWEDINKKFPIGSSVRIVCINKSDNVFFAKINGLEEINALCYYPDTDAFFIRVGASYEARVVKVMEDEKVFILKPYRELLDGQ